MKIKTLFILLLTLVVSAPLFARGHGRQYDTITPKAIWHPSKSTMQSIFTHCKRKEHTQKTQLQCLNQIMLKHGATEHAIKFMQQINGWGFLTAFIETDQVDVAQATVFAADHSTEYFLVNGNPKVINLSDPSLLKKISLKDVRGYKKLIQQYPKLALFAPYGFPQITVLQNDGQRFIFHYPLINGCLSCKTNVEAKVAFDFDKDGNFKQAKVLHFIRSDRNI